MRDEGGGEVRRILKRRDTKFKMTKKNTFVIKHMTRKQIHT